MKISIIGAGNGGQAMAGHFALMGHEVNLFNRTEEKIIPIIKKKYIMLNEALNGVGYLQKVTSNLSEAIDGAELIMITTTADAHRELAERMAPLIEDDQIIVLNPGRTLGALEFSTTIRKHTKKRVYIAEAQSLIYACRAESPGEVRVIGVKNKVLLAAYPAVDTDYVLNIINTVYNCFIKAENVLVTSMENIGAIFHPAVIMFNVAAIERGQSFYFYNDMTPAVAHFLEQIDNERLQIGEAYGLKLKTVSEWVSFAYQNIEGVDLCEKMKKNPAYYKILAPTTLHSRLLLEDIPTGILPFIELAYLADTKVPIMESILNIIQTLLKIDFRQRGRTLANLGIATMTAKEFVAHL